MKQPADDHGWHKVHDRLSRAAQAIASSQGNFEKHAIAAFQARTRELARRPQQRSELAELLEIITFMLGGESYAIEAKYVFEIMAPLPITAVPGTPAFLSGVINLRGEILAVFDLKTLLGLGSGTAEGAPRLVVLGEAQPQFAFIADIVDQVRTLEATELTLPVAPLGLLRRDAVRGVTANALLILDGQTILADERLMIEQREEGAVA